MYSRIGTIAGSGSSARSSANMPRKHKSAMTTPVASEYPVRPPAAFQPGWPMYTAGGNGQPSAEPTIAPVPSASRMLRRL